MKIKVLCNLEHSGFVCKKDQILEGDFLESSPLFDNLDNLIANKLVERLEDEIPVDELVEIEKISAPPKLKKGKK